MEGTWLIGQRPWATSLHPGAWASLLPEGPSSLVPQVSLLSKVGVGHPLSTNSSEKSAQMHIPSEAYFSGFVNLSFKTAPFIHLLVTNCS